MIRPTMIFDAKCWPIKEKHKNKLSVAATRMHRWMSGFTHLETKCEMNIFGKGLE